MKYTIPLIFLIALSGCSTTPSHVGPAEKTLTGDEFSIQATDNGFTVSGHFSNYQFIRNSRKGFTGCMSLINIAAIDYATSKNKKILTMPSWNQVEIVDHGRDLFTAIMHVNCKYSYSYHP